MWCRYETPIITGFIPIKNEKWYWSPALDERSRAYGVCELMCMCALHRYINVNGDQNPYEYYSFDPCHKHWRMHSDDCVLTAIQWIGNLPKIYSCTIGRCTVSYNRRYISTIPYIWWARQKTAQYLTTQVGWFMLRNGTLAWNELELSLWQHIFNGVWVFGAPHENTCTRPGCVARQ